MENASKALLIAGGVLIAMIIASFGVYLYGVYRSHADTMLSAMSESEISEFNAKFTVFEGRDLTINEVVSLKNLCSQYDVTLVYTSNIGLDHYMKNMDDAHIINNENLYTRNYICTIRRYDKSIVSEIHITVKA